MDPAEADRYMGVCGDNFAPRQADREKILRVLR